MARKLVPYWITFKGHTMDELPVGITAGCGVTALGSDDALQLIKELVFNDRELPTNVQVNVLQSADELDQKLVLPNSGNTLRRGVWFPLGYS